MSGILDDSRWLIKRSTVRGDRFLCADGSVATYSGSSALHPMRDINNVEGFDIEIIFYMVDFNNKLYAVFCRDGVVVDQLYPDKIGGCIVGRYNPPEPFSPETYLW